MIVAAHRDAPGAPGEMVRIRTLLETVPGWRYSPNVCSPTARSFHIEVLTSTAAERLTEEGKWTSPRS